MPRLLLFFLLSYWLGLTCPEWAGERSVSVRGPRGTVRIYTTPFLVPEVSMMLNEVRPEWRRT